MQHANGNIDRHFGSRETGSADGFAPWIVLYAVLMVAAMTFLAGANLLGDRFERSAPIAWNEPL